jgi:hypothetical protein
VSDTTPLPSDLKSLTQSKLHELAEQRKVEVAKTATKDDIIAALMAATVPKATPDAAPRPEPEPEPDAEPDAEPEALHFADDEYLVRQFVEQGPMLLDGVLGPGVAVPSFLIESALREDGQPAYTIEAASKVVVEHASREETA